jgi:predicted ester cyclase
VTEANKRVVRRLVAEVFNGGHLEVIDELYAPELAGAARRWITPFRASFPDVHMELLELIAEVTRWWAALPAQPPTGGHGSGRPRPGAASSGSMRSGSCGFRDGRIVQVWSLEDTLDRLRQLGLTNRHG